MKIFFAMVVLCFCLFMNVAQAKKLEAILQSEPSFSNIVTAFEQEGGIHGSNLRKWEKKIKKAPWLPTLYLGYTHSFSEGQNYGVSDNISISSGTVTIGPAENDYDLDEDVGQTVRVRAVWRLNEIVFNRNYFLLAKEKRDHFKQRSEMLAKLHKLYEQRYLFLAKYLHAPKRSTKASLFYTKYWLLTEYLDAITGGVFQNMWWRKK
jgi:hypothetical protein